MSLKRNLTLLKFHDKIIRKYFLKLTLHFFIIFASNTKNYLNAPKIILILISIKLMEKFTKYYDFTIVI